jgi:hypothetical protein
MTEAHSPTARRAGGYQLQPTGYRAFIPAPLPPDPPLRLEGELQTLLSRADHAIGRLDGSVQTLPNPDLFVFMYVRKEAVLSSQIEGTQSSLQDLLAAEANLLGSGAWPSDVGEVVNYVRAMNYGIQRLPDLPVSVRLIREIHQQLLDGVRGSHLTPGELRHSQNWIGAGGCTLTEAIFVPPPPHNIAESLGDLQIMRGSPDFRLEVSGRNHPEGQTTTNRARSSHPGPPPASPPIAKACVSFNNKSPLPLLTPGLDWPTRVAHPLPVLPSNHTKWGSENV